MTPANLQSQPGPSLVDMGVCKGTLLYRDRMRRLRNLGLVVHEGGHLITDLGRAAIVGRRMS
jgi:hypothetical protein